MAYRRAAELARRGTVSYISNMSNHLRQEPVYESLIASRLLSQQHSWQWQRCGFAFQFPRHASTQSMEGNSGSGTHIWSEDREEESGARVWSDAAQEMTTDDVSQGGQYGTELGSGITGEIASGSIWSILKVPADGIVALVDGLHSLTGAPWWITIIGSTLAFRAALFPFTITYIRKSAQFAASMPLLPPIKPPKDSNKSFSEQYTIFTKRRLELGVPSPFWATAGLLQAPFFLYWIFALRGMAMNHYPGFESGGTLWFVDLTVPVHGALGALFPSLIALTFFSNIQVSFRAIKPRNDLTGFFMKIYQWWLEAVTIPLFIMGFYLPQGVFMYWLTNNCFNLVQSVALQNDDFRGKFGLPLLSDMEKLRAKQASQSTEAADIKPETLDVNTLLMSATKYVTDDREDDALKLLKFLHSKYPDEAEVYNVYGMLHIKNQQWPEATEYYSLAISKSTDDAPRITAFMGAGISLYNQGRKQEAIDVMKPLVDIKVPRDPIARQKYLRALITLSSALSQEGLKEEALFILKKVLKWDRSVDVYIQKLEQDLDDS